MPDPTLFRALVSAYDAATHTASVALLDGPTAGMAGVACSAQCAPTDLTTGAQCLVLILADSQALLLCTY